MYSLMDKKLASVLNEDLGKLILRVSASILMLFHGVAKASHGIDGIAKNLNNHGLPEFLAYGVYLTEIILPIMIIIGLFTRLSSLFVGFTMIFAIYLVYADKIFNLTKHGALVIESALLFFVIAMAISLFGAGKYSLDEKWKKSQ